MKNLNVKGGFNQVSLKRELRRGDIILVNFKLSTGSIQLGIRPALVICNNKALRYGTIATVLPITSKIKQFPVHVPVDKGILMCDSQIISEQITSIDVNNQYIKYIGKVSEDTMAKVQRALFIQLDLKNN